MKKNKYYITTPIYYVNDKPHLGHAYTSLVSDTIARYQKLLKKDVFFITGTDEHGQKVEEAAKNNGVIPIDFVDIVSRKFTDLADSLELTNNDFIRTSERRHTTYVQKIWKKIELNDDIYLGSYKGWYSLRDESFITENEIITDKDNNKIGPSKDKLKWVEEPSYFFKLSKWQDKLLNFYQDNPDFVKPKSRYNEVVNFVQRGLQDLSISRTSFSWGIKVPSSPDHVIYVWLDALFNYISILDTPLKYEKYWPPDVHIVGKDILRFHAVFWPAFLMSCGITLPKRVFAHGWWTIGGEKMSKSLGNVIDPNYLVKKYGKDQIRYFLLREITFGDDGNFSEDSLVRRINSDLTNDFGNLVQRVLSMVIKYNQGTVFDKINVKKADLVLMKMPEQYFETYCKYMNNFEFSNSIKLIWDIIKKANFYVDDSAPWSLYKKDPDRLKTVLNILVNVIFKINVLVQPFLPISSKKIFIQLNLNPTNNFSCIYNEIEVGSKINKPEGVFPRINTSKDK